MSWWSFQPYVSVAQRRAKAQREVAKLKSAGQTITPVQIDGRKITATFWGKAWCDNLESYSDFASRLPRGRSYVRNGLVCDLQIAPGEVTAMVCGSELYHVTIKIAPLPADVWAAVKRQCAGQIGSLVELLQGKLSKAVMEVVTRKDGGLFPAPREIKKSCSCPDWADMCKHVAATLYGVGARLDSRPELLFTLRKVDHLELIAEAGDAAVAAKPAPSRKKIAAGDLADVFGVELETPAHPPAAPQRPTPTPTPTTPTRTDSGAKGPRRKVSPARSPGNASGTTPGRGVKKSSATKSASKKAAAAKPAPRARQVVR